MSQESNIFKVVTNASYSTKGGDAYCGKCFTPLIKEDLPPGAKWFCACGNMTIDARSSMVEPSAHNGSVAGSSPAGRTNLDALATYLNNLTGDALPGIPWQDCAAEITALARQRDALLAAAKQAVSEHIKLSGTVSHLWWKDCPLCQAEEALRAAIKSCEEPWPTLPLDADKVGEKP